MMVYSTGEGVHGFTLDPSIGEFLLSHPQMQIPEPGKYFSANVGNFTKWEPGVQRFTRWLEGLEDDGPALSQRYVGSMVSDVHRTLLKGGVFYYPADESKPQGKLRLLYEAIPMAFILEQAGGVGSTGVERILEVEPEDMHQRVPVFLGNAALVDHARAYIADSGS
jgi:fructose-1,6-bisphosphatase I